MSVKVPVKKVITQLKSKLKQVKDEYATIDRRKAEYDKAKDKYVDDLRDVVIAAIAKNPTLVREVEQNSRWRGGGGYVSVIALEVEASKIKGLPKEPSQPEFQYHSHNHIAAEIEQMIRVLEMTDDEFVNATTLKSVTAYL